MFANSASGIIHRNKFDPSAHLSLILSQARSRFLNNQQVRQPKTKKGAMKPQRSLSNPPSRYDLLELAEEEEERRRENGYVVDMKGQSRVREIESDDNTLVSSDSHLIPLYSTDADIFSLCISRDDLAHGRVNIMSRIKSMSTQGIFLLIVSIAAVFIIALSLSVHYFHNFYGDSWKRQSIDTLTNIKHNFNDNNNNNNNDNNNYSNNNKNNDNLYTMIDGTADWHGVDENDVDLHVIQLDWDFNLSSVMPLSSRQAKANSYTIVYYNISTETQLCNALVSISSFYDLLEHSRKFVNIDIVLLLFPHIRPTSNIRQMLQHFGVMTMSIETRNEEKGMVISRSTLHRLLRGLKRKYFIFVDSQTFLFHQNIMPLFSLFARESDFVENKNGLWYVSLQSTHDTQHKEDNKLCISSYLFLFSAASTTATMEEIISLKQQFICGTDHFNTSLKSWENYSSLRFIPSHTIVNLRRYARMQLDQYKQIQHVIGVNWEIGQNEIGWKTIQSPLSWEDWQKETQALVRMCMK
ncbi:hypothetical protein RFI_17210 [Reticulomyxa filosa]|uniref:Uncharacterized protein n=1 Tax=Reticulomyxa filosa TaxID=46433 RepID=X6N277_RETFI|nr:hypothetical protein RFI_17210 [Reticulomyxa filosa]|eukprot:ETO20008.1 hypothetical protein RFI_17210 [Reticulomyxa filosa]